MNKIAAFRKKAGLTQDAAARAAGYEHQSRWSSYERGVRTPGVDDIRRILKVLNDHGVTCSFEDVFVEEEDRAA